MALRVCLGWVGAVAIIAAALPLAASAQVLPRIKAKVVSFDGTTLTVMPLAGASTPPPPSRPANAKPGITHGGTPDAGTAAPGTAPMTFAVLPDTRYVGTEKAAFTDIKVGDFAGAAVHAGTGGRLRADEVFLYPDALRGTGEGRLSESGQLVVNGTVSDVKPGLLTLHYRGLTWNGKICEGRAPPPAFASRLACAGDAFITVDDGVPVTKLAPGDASLVVPDAIVTVSVARNRDGVNVTPGLIVEKPQALP